MVLPINRRQPTRRSGIVERAVPNIAAQMNPAAAGSGFGAIAAGFAKFAGKLSEEEEKKRVLQDEIAIAEVAQSVYKRPEEAWEALRSGNYGAFVPEQQAGRVNFMRYAPLAVADALASAEATKFINELKKAGPEIYGPKLSQDFLNNKLKGLPPRAALKFTDTYNKSVKGALKDRQATMEKFQQGQLKDRLTPILRSGLKTGSISSLEDMNKLVNQIAATSGTNVVEGVMTAQTQMDELIGRMSASADQEIANRATALLYRYDEKRGSSVADRLTPAKVASLQEEQEKNWYLHVGKRATEIMAQAEEMVASGTSPIKVFQWVNNALERTALRPENPEWRDLRIKLHKGIQEEFEKTEVDSRPVSTAKNNGWTPAMVSKKYEALENKGVAPFTDAEFIFIASQNIMPKPLQNKLRGMIVQGNTEEMAIARIFIRTAMKRGKYGISNYLSDDTAQAIFFATENANIQDSVKIQERLAEALQDRDGEWGGAFYDLARKNNLFPTIPKVSKYAVNAAAFRHIFGDETKDLRKELGMENIAWEDLSQELRGVHAERLLDIVGVGAGVNANASMDDVAKAFLELFKDDLELGKVGSDGKPKWTKRRTPTMVEDRNGTTMRYKGAGPLEVADFVAEVEAQGLTKKLGYVSDDTTERDGSVLMTADTGAGLQEFILKPGMPISIPEKLAMSLGLNGFFEIGDDPNHPDRVIVEAAAPGEKFSYRGIATTLPKNYTRIQVSSKSHLLWNNANNTWQLRRHLGRSMPMLTQEQSEAIAAKVNAEKDKMLRELERRATISLRANQYWDSANGTLAMPEGELLKMQSRLEYALRPASKGGYSDPGGRSTASAQLMMVNIALRAHKAKQAAIEAGQVPAKVIAQAVAADDVMTWDNERLDAAFNEARKTLPKGHPERTKLFQEWKRRKEGGAPIAPETMLPEKANGPGFTAISPLNVTQRSNYNTKLRDKMTQALVDGVNNGTYHVSVLGVADEGAKSFEDVLKAAEDITRRAGGSQGTQLKGGMMTPFMTEVVNFIARSEGFEKFPYKDPGADQYNIGHGTYLGRTDVQAGLEAAGTTLAEVKKRGITEEEASILTSFVVATHEQYLRKEFDGFALKAHQRMALHSFIYSSRWGRDGKPTVMGPKLISAIKSGNDALAAQIIRSTLKVADPNADIRQGMQNRRNREATMYMGTSRISTD